LGVLWLRFDNCEHPTISCGTVLDPKELRYEGMHFIAPWNKLYIYDRRLKATNEIYDAISSDGVQLHATVTVRQQLNWEAAGVVHQFVGPDYMQTMVLPEIGNRVREVIAQYRAEEVYYEKRLEVQNRIFQLVIDRFTN